MLAAIDIGTNSVKLLVGRGVFPVLQRIEITRLGEGLRRGGRISPEAARRTIAALTRFRQLALRHGVERIAAVGTRALRAARNREDFLRRCEREAGLRVRILPGRAEASLGFAAALHATRARRIVALDVGGGSVEIMTGSRKGMERAWSLPLGAVAMTERFLKSDPPSAREIAKLDEALLRRLSKIPLRTGELVGIGGTVSVLARFLRGPRFSRAALERLAEKLARQTTVQRERAGLERGRADIIVAGARVLLGTMHRFRARTLRACTLGLRHALLAEMAQGRWR